jgi:phosphoserine phosphatase
MTTQPVFASVVLDADSTLCGIEGIDWLAGQRGPDVATEIAALTNRAMNGEIPLDAVYGARLALIRPTRLEIQTLGDVYCRNLAPGAESAINDLLGAGVNVHIVSSGIHQALEPVLLFFQLEADVLHAVSLTFHADGAYSDYDSTSSLTLADGKAVLVNSLKLPRPILAVGDGATDLAMRSAVDEFAAYTGFVRREAVVRDADRELRSFEELRQAVLP